MKNGCLQSQTNGRPKVVQAAGFAMALGQLRVTNYPDMHVFGLFNFTPLRNQINLNSLNYLYERKSCIYWSSELTSWTVYSFNPVGFALSCLVGLTEVCMEILYCNLKRNVSKQQSLNVSWGLPVWNYNVLPVHRWVFSHSPKACMLG